MVVAAAIGHSCMQFAVATAFRNDHRLAYLQRRPDGLPLEPVIRISFLSRVVRQARPWRDRPDRRADGRRRCIGAALSGCRMPRGNRTHHGDCHRNRSATGANVGNERLIWDFGFGI